MKAYALSLLEKALSEWPVGLRSLAASVRECAAGRWHPAAFTIDKSREEYNAVTSVFLGVLIRLCFWHLSNAILRWEGSVGETALAGSGEEAEAIPQDSVVPRSVRKRVISALVAVLRLETLVAFEDAKTELLQRGIETIVDAEAGDRPAVARNLMVLAVKRYLVRNWLESEVWLPTCADHLLPSGIDLGDVNTVGGSGSSTATFLTVAYVAEELP